MRYKTGGQFFENRLRGPACKPELRRARFASAPSSVSRRRIDQLGPRSFGSGQDAFHSGRVSTQNHRGPGQLSCSVQSAMRQPQADTDRLDSPDRRSPKTLLFLSTLESARPPLIPGKSPCLFTFTCDLQYRSISLLIDSRV